MTNLNDSTNQKLQQALHYLKDKKWSVIPIGKNKRPLINWKKYQEEKASEEEIIDWFKKYPDANLGVVTGKISDLIVVDIDPRHDGSDELFRDIKTLKSKTGGGGWHYFFQFEEGIQNNANIKQGIDIRGEGGYVIVPPSVHLSGNNYEWLAGLSHSIAVLPGFIKSWFSQTKPNNKISGNKVLEGVMEGSRNDTAASLIGKLLAYCPPKEWKTVAWPLLQAWNQKNNPPLTEQELKGVFNSIAKRESFKKNRSETQTTPQIDPAIFVPVTLEEAINAVETILPGKRDLVLLAIATNISHMVDAKTPLWLMFVGVPSSAKTEVARMLSFDPNVFFLDTLTENAFISGSKNQNGSEPTDLLPLLNGRCFVIKDFTTTLSQREESVRKILGDLTSIYDDSFSKHSPARGTVRYHSFFSILGCVTPQALNRHQRYMNQIGPRFLFYRVPSSNDEEIDHGFEVLWSAKDSISKFKDAQTKVSAYSYQLSEKIAEMVVENETTEVMAYLNSLAKFIAKARGTVLTRAAEFLNTEGEKISFYEPVEIQIEEPYRALLQLRVLARALASVLGKRMITLEELELVRKVALSSMPADRALLLSVIVTEDKPWSAKEIADELGISHKTALRQLDELVSLKILNKSEQGMGLANLYSVSLTFHAILYSSVEFMFHLPTETQTPQRGEGQLNNNPKIEDLSESEQQKLVEDVFSNEVKLG